MWGVIKLQAFILHGLLLTCTLKGSIKAQIDFTYQCRHCWTWHSSHVVHVCLITWVLTGSRHTGPASHITPWHEKPRESEPFQLCCVGWTVLFVHKLHKSNENCLQRNPVCVCFICGDKKHPKVVITSKPQANCRIIHSQFCADEQTQHHSR